MVHRFAHRPHSWRLAAASLKDIPAYVMALASCPAPWHECGRPEASWLQQRRADGLRRAYKVVYRQGLTTEQAIDELEKSLTCRSPPAD